MNFSGGSIGTNMKEGQGRHSQSDSAREYAVASKEARETHHWLRLLVATGILTANHLGGPTTECDELIAILTAIVKNTRGTQK